MSKEYHVRLSNELSKIIDNSSNLLNIRKNKLIEKYIKNGLLYEELNLKTDILNNEYISLNKKLNYIKKLLMQLYADIDLEPKEISSSHNLIIFNKNYKDKKFDD